MRNRGLRLLSAVLCMILVLDAFSSVAFATTAERSLSSEDWEYNTADEIEWDDDEWEEIQNTDLEDEPAIDAADESASAPVIISGQPDSSDTEVISEEPVSALVDEATTGSDTEVITSENELAAMAELADEGYEETIVKSQSKARAAASETYEVSKAGTNGKFTKISTHTSFSAAKSAMNSKAAAESTTLDKNSYVVRYNGRVVAMTSGIAIVTSTAGGTLTFDNTYGGRASYVTNNSVLYYYDTESVNKIKVGISGITNYTSYENLMLVPLPFTSEYATSSVNTYEMGYYQKNSNGDMVHVITTFSDKDKTTHYESGEGTTSSSIAVDKAPSFMSSGKKYYSMDGVNFYNDLQLTSKAGTYYNYYQYLSYHTKTSYTASELNTAVRSMTSNSNSVLLNQGSAFIAAQNNYGINALMELAFACLESGYGTSNYAINRNNLFGINAGDANPNDASYYSSVSSCVDYHAGTLLKQAYLDALTDSHYMGANTGKKSVGVNVAYASDPYHGEKIASVAYSLDKKLGGKDYGKYTIGISGTSTPVYSSASTSTTLYKLMNNKTNTALTGLPVVVLDKSGSYYKVQSDMPLVNGKADCMGTYSYNHVGYTKTSDITIVQGSTPGDSAVSVKAPTSPKAATSSTSSLKVSWTKSADAEGYEVYYSTSSSGSYTKVKDTTSTSFTHSSLTSSKIYYYKIRAYKTVSGTKYYSSYTSVVKAATKPTQTTGLTLKNSTPTSIKVSWNKVSGVSGYRIYRSTKKDSGYSLVKTVTSGSTTSWTNSSLKTGTTYYYKVRAYKTANEEKVFGAYSAVKSLKAKPAQTTSLTLKNSTPTSIKVSWNKVSGASGYRIYRSTKKDSGYSLVKTVSSGSTTSWTNSSLKTGTTYYYKVRAYKTSGGTKIFGAYSSVKSLKAKPAVPGSVKVTSASSTKAKVSWNKVSGASGYEVYRSTKKDSGYKRVKTTSSTSWTNSSLKKGTTYYYKVRAYKTVNGKKVYGAYSSVKSIKK